MGSANFWAYFTMKHYVLVYPEPINASKTDTQTRMLFQNFGARLRGIAQTSSVDWEYIGDQAILLERENAEKNLERIYQLAAISEMKLRLRFLSDD